MVRLGGSVGQGGEECEVGELSWGVGWRVRLQGLLEEDGGSPEAGPSWQKKMEFCTGELSKSRSEKVWVCVCNISLLWRPQGSESCSVWLLMSFLLGHEWVHSMAQVGGTSMDGGPPRVSRPESGVSVPVGVAVEATALRNLRL